MSICNNIYIYIYIYIYICNPTGADSDTDSNIATLLRTLTLIPTPGKLEEIN